APAHVLLIAFGVTGGSGFGGNGVGYRSVCGNWITPPLTSAWPLSLSALTLPLLQLPTPIRGVLNEPLTCTWPPIDRLPFVPTAPPEFCVTGDPPAMTMAVES